METLIRLGYVLGTLLLTTLVLFIIYVLVIVMPVSMMAEVECYEHGYPKAVVDVALNAYCVNLDGVVQGKVESLEDLR